MVKRDFLAWSLALNTMLCCGLPMPSQSATLSHNEEDIVKAKDAIAHKNYSTALTILKPLAEQQGLRPAQYHLALMYLEGQGVAADPKKAAELFKKAADQGGKHAAYNLGLLYAQGRGVKQDFNKAFEIFKKVADEGDADAQYNVGLLYLSGQGIKQNSEEAAKYFGLAADQGQVDAQYNKALLYLGDKDESEKSKAFKILQKLANNGFVPAQSNFGLMYLHGDTVPKDAKMAATWITKAAKWQPGSPV